MLLPRPRCTTVRGDGHFEISHVCIVRREENTTVRGETGDDKRCSTYLAEKKFEWSLVEG
jgi:hypothetical protein